MTPADLDAVRARIQRAFQSINDSRGFSYETSYKASETDFTTHFHAVGVKAPEQLEDDFLNLFIWVWSLKDYLKEVLEARGSLGKRVEEEVNRCAPLTYVADIANRAKHGTLRQSRSGKFATLVDVGFDYPQDTIEKIVVAGSSVTLHVKNPGMIQIHATVLISSGERLDALSVLEEAMSCWESKVIPTIAA